MAKRHGLMIITGRRSLRTVSSGGRLWLHRMRRTGYRRYAWMFLFATGVFLVMYGIAHVVLGLTGATEGGQSLTQLGASAPAADYIKLLTVEKGVFGLVTAVLVIGITLKSYR